MTMVKSILVLRASKDICGDEVGLVTHHCQLLGMTVFKEDVPTGEDLMELGFYFRGLVDAYCETKAIVFRII